LPVEELYDKHLRTERLYLINGGLDIVYMGAGLLMKHYSKKNVNRPDLLRGYGISIILQGGFLFIFDGVMYLIQRTHRTNFLENIYIGLDPGGVNFGLVLKF